MATTAPAVPAATTTTTTAEKPKTMKVIFVEDIAQAINDLAPALDDGSWTSEIVQICILKAANIHGVPVVFRYKSTTQPKEEGAAPVVSEEIVPIYQSTVFDASLKTSKTEAVAHSYNLFTVSAQKNQKSKFVEDAKAKPSAQAPVIAAAATATATATAEGTEKPTVTESKKAPAQQQQTNVYASLDFMIRQFHANERSDTLPHNVVTAGDSRLNIDKFTVSKATFYNEVSLLQQHKKLRQQEIAEYQLALEVLTKYVQSGRRLAMEQLGALQVTIEGKKVPVSANFADRLDEETEALVHNVHPRNKANFVKKFERMWNMVEKFNPQTLVKEIPTPAK